MGLTYNSIMPFGVHQGKKMSNVPGDYLLWVFNNNKCTPAVAFYIAKNLEKIKINIQKKQINK